MAYNDSGELPIGQSYQLGEYVFSIRVTPDPGEGTTGINVRCDKGDERAVVSGEVTGTVESWSVEANETEASVYAAVSAFDPSKMPEYRFYGGSVGSADHNYHGRPTTRNLSVNCSGTTWGYTTNNGGNITIISTDPITIFIHDVYHDGGYPSTWDDTVRSSSVTVKGTTLQTAIAGTDMYHTSGSFSLPAYDETSRAFIEELIGDNDTLIGRFAIDLREAGGGPDGDWDEPGDTGDPSYKLNVNVTGASAGTHDAAAVPVAPTDQPVYGSGGAGGNGGGGGAGQSTAIARRFATDKAGSVNQEVTLRPPGVGSKGSPGGRGGDGCILIFY